MEITPLNELKLLLELMLKLILISTTLDVFQMRSSANLNAMSEQYINTYLVNRIHSNRKLQTSLYSPDVTCVSETTRQDLVCELCVCLYG